MAAAVARADAGLADQGPPTTQVEEGGEDVAVIVLRGSVHRGIGRVAFLVAGLGLFPARLRTNLRRDEGGGAVGEVEAAQFALDAQALGFLALPLLTWDGVAEGDVVVRDLEDDAEALMVFVLNVDDGLRGLVGMRRGLGATHLVSVAYNG